MSKMIELDFQPDDSTLRQFGFIALGGFGLLACFAWFEILIFSGGWLGDSRPIVVGVLAGLGAVAALFSLVFPRANLPIFIGLSVVAYPIGFVLSYVIMGFLYFVLIAPLALFFRVIGRDTMHRRYDPEAESYWSDRRPTRPAEAYFRQY